MMAEKGILDVFVSNHYFVHNVVLDSFNIHSPPATSAGGGQERTWSEKKVATVTGHAHKKKGTVTVAIYDSLYPGCLFQSVDVLGVVP